MAISIPTLNYILALGTLGFEITGVLLLFLYLFRNRFEKLRGFVLFLSNYGLWIGFVIALFGTTLSLFYSEVLGFDPCGLCWLQRVFLYPQVILLGMAAWKKEYGMALYSIVLSVVGAIIALYQHYLQMGGADILPCPATSNVAADCAKRLIFEFGHITFPYMAFVSFAVIIILMLFVRKRLSL